MNVYESEIAKLKNMKKTLIKKMENMSGKDFDENELYHGAEALIDMQVMRMQEQLEKEGAR